MSQSKAVQLTSPCYLVKAPSRFFPSRLVHKSKPRVCDTELLWNMGTALLILPDTGTNVTPSTYSELLKAEHVQAKPSPRVTLLTLPTPPKGGLLDLHSTDEVMKTLV